MADLKISALTAATSVDPLDLLPTVDVSDTTMNASGTTKKTTRELLQTYAAGTLTTDKKILDLSATWNAAGVTFTGFKLNVTDTASASGSLLLDVQKGGTSQLVLNKSGNLGLGVTPSAWGTAKAFDILTDGGAVFAFTRNVGLTSNAYYSGSAWVYKSTGFATRYESNAGGLGSHLFSTAASGTAGNNITFVDRVSIGHSSCVVNFSGADYDFRIEGDTDANLFFVDASVDRVGIGTNAPETKFAVGTSASQNTVRINGGSSADRAPVLTLFRVGSIETTMWAGNNDFYRFGLSVNPASYSDADLLSSAAFVVSGNGKNLGLGSTSFGTSATKTLSIGNGTAPTTGPADTVQIYSSDLSAGNTMLSVYTEGTSVSDSVDNAVTKKIAVRINGTVYYLLADTDNS